MSPDDAFAPVDPHLAAAMTAIVLALIAAVLLLALVNDDEVRR